MRLRNCTAAFGWGLSAAFLLGCGLFTYILARDGSSGIRIHPPDVPESYPPWFMPLVLAVFWVGGIAVARYVASKPCTSVEVGPDKSVVVVRRFPSSRSVRHLKAAELSPPEIIESTDSEGAPYFLVNVTAADGCTVCIAEGHDRERCESVRVAFDDAIGRGPGHDDLKDLAGRASEDDIEGEAPLAPDRCPARDRAARPDV